MEIELPWTEKYRPKKLSEVVGHKEIIKRLKVYVKEKNLPNILLAGPAGVGKTASILALAHELFGDIFAQNFLELNASVGPETPVLIRKKGAIKRTNFQKLADEYFKDGKSKYAATPDLEILSIDENYNVVFKPVKLISRHKVKKIAKIKYEGGTVRTSLDHSVIVNEEGSLAPKKVSELKNDDCLITFKTPIKGGKQAIEFEKYSPQIFNPLRSGLVRNPKIKTVVENKILNQDLSWIFGLYLAEGCTSLSRETNGQVIFALGYPQEMQTVELLQNKIKNNLDLNTRIDYGSSGFNRSRRSSIQVRILNTQLSKFFRDNFYAESQTKKAPYKRIPEFIYSAPIPERTSFLKGYVGDASGEWDEYLRYSSSSKENLIDLTWLGRLTDLDTSCYEKEARIVWKLPSYSYIKTELVSAKPFTKLVKEYSIPLTSLLRHSLYCKKSKRICKKTARQLIKQIKSMLPAENKALISLKKLVNSPLAEVVIRKIEIEDYAGYVYDVTVPGSEMFWGGTSPILLHNSDERGIDVIRGKIKDFAAILPYGGANFKIIFLDESDSMTRDAQNALRRTMETYAGTARFCLSCNYSSRIIEPIQSRCALLRFKPLSEVEIIERLKYIAEKEKLHVTADGYKALVYASEGDLRKAINFLQTASTLGGKINEETVFKIAARARPKEVRELIELALKGKFEESRKKLDKLLFEYGMSGEDVMLQIYREIIGFDIDPKLKVELIDKIGEYNFRLTEGANERIQLEALLAYFVLIGSKTT